MESTDERQAYDGHAASVRGEPHGTHPTQPTEGTLMRYNPRARLDRSQVENRRGSGGGGGLGGMGGFPMGGGGGGGLRVGGGVGGLIVLIIFLVLQFAGGGSGGGFDELQF